MNENWVRQHEDGKTIQRLQNKINVLVKALYRLASNEAFGLPQDGVGDELQLRMLFAEYCAKICDNKSDVGDEKQYQAILPEWRDIVIVNYST